MERGAAGTLLKAVRMIDGRICCQYHRYLEALPAPQKQAALAQVVVNSLDRECQVPMRRGICDQGRTESRGVPDPVPAVRTSPLRLGTRLLLAIRELILPPLR